MRGPADYEAHHQNLPSTTSLTLLDPKFSASQEVKNQVYILNTRTSQSYFSYDMFVLVNVFLVMCFQLTVKIMYLQELPPPTHTLES